MQNILVRSFAIATIFSLIVLLGLAASEQTGNLRLGEYLFIFAVVAYGLTLQVAGGEGPGHLPVVVAWLTLLPAMVVFYTPVFALPLLWRRKHGLVPMSRPN